MKALKIVSRKIEEAPRKPGIRIKVRFLYQSCLLTGVLLILASSSVSHATEVDIFQGRVDRLIYGDIYTTFGKSESEIKSRIGQPIKRETKNHPNSHVKGATDTLIKLHYQGLSIDLLRSGVTGADMPVSIVLDYSGYVFSGGLSVGTEMKDLEAHLGPPWRVERSGALAYGDAERNSIVTFSFVEDKVNRIMWRYWFD